jgi:hypothetical protein
MTGIVAISLRTSHVSRYGMQVIIFLLYQAVSMVVHTGTASIRTRYYPYGVSIEPFCQFSVVYRNIGKYFARSPDR